MNSNNLYENVYMQLCRQIFDGTIQNDENLPAERVLAENMKVSRVTVRKALELLEKEQLLVREVGSGNRIHFTNSGHAGTLDMITLVAPAENPFFSNFISAFQSYAHLHDSLVLYAQKPENESLEQCLFRLYEKGLHNVVVWPEDSPVHIDSLMRLRGLGMNMVFFDTDKATPYADCVALDNNQAITALINALQATNGSAPITYIGWDNFENYSIKTRCDYFRQFSPAGCSMVNLPWHDHVASKAILTEYFVHNKGSFSASYLCGDQEIGTLLTTFLAEIGSFTGTIASIDDFHSPLPCKYITYDQDFKKIAETIYEHLLLQNEAPMDWVASQTNLPGILQSKK